jgi:hypothetical protein
MEAVDEMILADAVIIGVQLPVSDTEHKDFVVSVPRATLSSGSDPTLFYRIPKGCALWEGGHALAVALGESDMLQRLVNQTGPSSLPCIKSQPLRVIELGSGLAPLPSYVAAAMYPQAHVVVATDYMDRIVEATATSIKANESMTPPITVAKYAFGDSLEVFDEKFDLILGADLLYRDGNTEKQKQLVKSLDDLSHSDSVVVISHTWRETDSELEFIENQMSHWKLVGRVNDKRTERWRKYGRVGHDSQPGACCAQHIEIFTFIRQPPAQQAQQAGAAC